MMLEPFIMPLSVSIKTVLAATVITFFLGIAAARWMVDYKGRFSSLIDVLFLLPIVLPPTVIGFGLLLLFGSRGPLGKLLALFDTTIIFSWPATVVTAVIVAFPLMYMTARGGFEQVDPNLENAARTLGAGEWRLFWTVTLPLSWPTVMAATVLAFTRALGEFGATLMLAGNLPGRTTTLPVAIYFRLQAGQMHEALVLTLVVFIFALASLALLAYWKAQARRNGRGQ
ncbi:MAG: molybdate ABC transporter permease subunit [Firmicutes bacterium]|nr:molybdate ABC transporter permease subunit [Bacillota bacterium]